MSRKIFHRIDEIPRKKILNNSKIGPKYLKNPKVWIFTECSLTPFFCSPETYKVTVKNLIQNSKGQKLLDNVLFWVYATDLVPHEVYCQMCTASLERNRYMDLFKDKE